MAHLTNTPDAGPKQSLHYLLFYSNTSQTQLYMKFMPSCNKSKFVILYRFQLKRHELSDRPTGFTVIQMEVITHNIIQTSVVITINLSNKCC